MNGFWSAFTQKKFSPKIIKDLSKQFFNLNITFMEVDYMETLKLTFKEKLTFYDASYLYLAQSQNLPLLTLDKHLILFSPTLSF